MGVFTQSHRNPLRSEVIWKWLWQIDPKVQRRKIHLKTSTPNKEVHLSKFSWTISAVPDSCHRKNAKFARIFRKHPCQRSFVGYFGILGGVWGLYLKRWLKKWLWTPFSSQFESLFSHVRSLWVGTPTRSPFFCYFRVTSISSGALSHVRPNPHTFSGFCLTTCTWISLWAISEAPFATMGRCVWNQDH